MRKLIAICFLGLLLFNIAGYRLWFYYAGRQATAQLVASVERQDYASDELLTLSVPLALPYHTDWADWEQVRGEIQIDGVTYQYVQRKVENGQLVLQCLPNKQQAKIESARDRFFQLANSFHADQPVKKDAGGHTMKVTKPALTDFDDHWSCWGIASLPLMAQAAQANEDFSLPQLFDTTPGQPPEQIA